MRDVALMTRAPDLETPTGEAHLVSDPLARRHAGGKFKQALAAMNQHLDFIGHWCQRRLLFRHRKLSMLRRLVPAGLAPFGVSS